MTDLERQLILKYINIKNVKYNNDNISKLEFDYSKVYFLSYSEDSGTDGESKLMCLIEPIKLNLGKLNGEVYITYTPVKRFLDNEEFKDYKEVEKYKKGLNLEMTGDEYLTPYFYNSILMVNLALRKSKYKYIHISDNIEDVKRDFELLKNLS